MAVKTISELTNIIALNDNYAFVIDDGDHNYKITWAAIKALLGSVSQFEADPNTESYAGFLKLTLSNGTVLRAKPSDPDKQDILTWDTTPTADSDHAISSGAVKAALDGKQVQIAQDQISLSATWAGAGPYSQVVSVSGATAQSKIDLQPSASVLTQLAADGVTALYVENNNGALTAYALGAAPTTAMTIQCTRTEVV